MTPDVKHIHTAVSFQTWVRLRGAATAANLTFKEYLEGILARAVLIGEGEALGAQGQAVPSLRDLDEEVS